MGPTLRAEAHQPGSQPETSAKPEACQTNRSKTSCRLNQSLDGKSSRSPKLRSRPLRLDSATGHMPQHLEEPTPTIMNRQLYICTCLLMSTCTHKHVSTYTCTCKSYHACMHACMHVCMHEYVCVWMYVWIYICIRGYVCANE